MPEQIKCARCAKTTRSMEAPGWVYVSEASPEFEQWKYGYLCRQCWKRVQKHMAEHGVETETEYLN
jgi:DNA-directed RNA polymerase subunit RPC12/RpoP